MGFDVGSGGDAAIMAPEGEAELVRRYRETGSRRALDRLMAAHLRLIGRIVLQYRGYGLPTADLVEHGRAGLRRAIDGFDPAKGLDLAIYAAWWIKAAVQQRVLESWPSVRGATPVRHKQLLFCQRKTRALVDAVNGGDLSAGEIADIAAAAGPA